MEDKNHISIRVFISMMGLSLVILAVKIVIKKFSPIDTVIILAETFAYVFTISIWVGLAGMFLTDIYEKIKKNLERNIIFIKLKNCNYGTNSNNSTAKRFI